MKRATIVLTALTLVLFQSASAMAQTGGSCLRDSVATYGLAVIECVHCTVHDRGGWQWVEYATEPVIGSVSPAINAANSLIKGDVIISVDGLPITTQAGATRLASPVPGKATRFEIRRAQSVMSVAVTPYCVARMDHALGERVPVDLSSLAAQGGAFRSNSGGGQSTGQGARGTTSGSGSAGFLFASVRMRTLVDSSGSHAVYAAFPTVSRVEERSPAALAGLQAGDVLHAVDGLPLTTLAGTRRLTSINAGQRITLTVERAGKLVELTLTAGRRGGG